MPVDPSHLYADQAHAIPKMKSTEELAGPEGEVVVTTDAAGRCIAVTRQDSESRILSVIWEA